MILEIFSLAYQGVGPSSRSHRLALEEIFIDRLSLLLCVISSQFMILDARSIFSLAYQGEGPSSRSHRLALEERC
jgi:hypothetical protein